MLTNAHNITCIHLLSGSWGADWLRKGFCLGARYRNVMCSMRTCSYVKIQANVWKNLQTRSPNPCTVQRQASFTWSHCAWNLQECRVGAPNCNQVFETSHSPRRSAAAALISPSRHLSLYRKKGMAWHPLAVIRTIYMTKSYQIYPNLMSLQHLALRTCSHAAVHGEKNAHCRFLSTKLSQRSLSKPGQILKWLSTCGIFWQADTECGGRKPSLLLYSTELRLLPAYCLEGAGRLALVVKAKKWQSLPSPCPLLAVLSLVIMCLLSCFGRHRNLHDTVHISSHLENSFMHVKSMFATSRPFRSRLKLKRAE